MKTKELKCSGYDYALVMIAKQELRAPNKFICTCIHCHAQAVTKETIQHTARCCHNRKAI